MALRKILPELALLCGLAVAAAFVVNALSPRGIALFGDWDTTKGVVTAKAKNDAVDHKREIELPEARALFDRGVLFVDARDFSDYEAGHIRGAVSLPAREIWERLGEFQAAHPARTPLVAYCSGRECSDSHDLARDLRDAGYEDVKVYVDGYPAWESEGLPIEK